MTKERRAAERLICKGAGAILVLAVAFWAVPQIWDKLSPFIVAVPLAALLQPVITFLTQKLRFRRSIAVLICVLIIIAILLAISYWLVVIVTEQAPALVSGSGNILSEAVTALQTMSDNLMSSVSMDTSPRVQELLRNAMDQAVKRVTEWGSDMATGLVAFAVNFVTGLPYGMIYLSFLAMALYFITNNYSEIRSYLPGGKRRRQDSNTTQLTHSATRSLMGYLRVQGTFAVMVFVVSAIALRIFKFKNPTMLALVAGLMEMIPMVGSGLLYIAMSIIFFLAGDAATGFQVLALTGVLQLLRRVLEPKLMSNSIGISPLQSLIGMFVGMRFGGILGLIGGPVLMSVVVGAFRGDMLKGVSDDLYLVVRWVKRRWSAENIEEDEEEEPPEAEKDPPEAEEEKEEDKNQPRGSGPKKKLFSNRGRAR